MEILYWWLISLPIFFALGWMAARIDIREILREAKALPRAFAQSYRHLAEANPEAALAPFKQFRLPDNVSFELLLSLGVLNRRQGQFTEAIRLHEQLHQRIDLSPAELDEVVWELSQDYLKAGMLDRSVMCLQALATPERQNRAVLTMLEIFQLQKQWDKALEYANKVTNILGMDERAQCAHFHCELALRAHQQWDAPLVAHHLESALNNNPRNVRIPLLRGECAFDNKDFAGAVAHWQALENLAPNYLILVLDKMHHAYSMLRQNDEEERVLVRYFENNPSAPLLVEVAKSLGERLSPARLISWLDRYESALQSWMTMNVAVSLVPKMMSTDEGRALAERLKKYAVLMRPQHFGFVCHDCGFLLQNHVWRCPGCGSWDSYSPLPRSVA